MSRSEFLDINSNQSQGGLITDEEQILDKFIIINVLNDFNDYQARLGKNLGFLSEIEIKKHIDGLRGFKDFQSKDVKDKVKTVLDLLIADREKKIESLNEILDSEVFLYTLDLPHAYGIYLNSLDKTKKELENVLVNRLGLLNGNLNQVLAEVQLGRFKTLLARSQETSRTFSQYGVSPTVDETSQTEIFRLVCYKYKETQPDNFKVLAMMMYNEMGLVLRGVPEEQLSSEEKQFLERLTLERCNAFCRAWLENKISRLITYEDYLYLINNYDGYTRYSKLLGVNCQSCYSKYPITKILEGNECGCTVCYYCVVKKIEEMVQKNEASKEQTSFDCPRCKKSLKVPEDLPSIDAYLTKLKTIAKPEK